MLELETSKEVVLTQCDIQLVGDDGILGLSQVAVGKDIARQCPVRIVVLSVVHHDLDDRRSIVILRRTRLILERIGATQGVLQLAELRVQLGSDRGKAILCIVTAGE